MRYAFFGESMTIKSAKAFLTEDEKHRIVNAIKKAEEETSGEIRVHIEDSSQGHPIQRAKQVFERLGMHNTKLKNGTLIYLSVNDRKFAVIGDSGIHALVPPNFWEEIKEVMHHHFKKGEFCLGICSGIEQIGEKLKTHFPHTKDDVNELSDDISFGDN